VFGELGRNLRAVDTGRGDRVLAVTQVADDLGGDHLVKNTDETLDVDDVAGGDGTGGHVFAGVIANLGDVEPELIVGLAGLSAHGRKPLCIRACRNWALSGDTPRFVG
jgi:hypothetical protein